MTEFISRNRGLLAASVLYGAVVLDELVYGTQSAVLPQLRNDLGLSYTQVGLLFTVPGFLGLLTDPVVGLLGDTRLRRWLILGGLAATALGLFLAAWGESFVWILLAFSVLYLASGAYVNLVQATLIDRDYARSEKTMARWTLLSWVGVTVAPFLVAALAFFGFGWRVLYMGLAGLAAVYLLPLSRQRLGAQAGQKQPSPSLRSLLVGLRSALRSRELLRWIVLTQLADLLVDRLFEVAALYFSDVAGTSPAAASGAVAALTMAGLAGSALLLTALRKISGLRILRLSALLAFVSYAALLLVPTPWLKFPLLACVGFLTAGWFPLLRAKTYQTLPGQSGLVVAVTSLDNVSSLLVPLVIGRIGDSFGLQWAMWLLILGPLALLVGLPPRDGLELGTETDSADEQ